MFSVSIYSFPFHYMTLEESKFLVRPHTNYSFTFSFSYQSNHPKYLFSVFFIPSQIYHNKHMSRKSPRLRHENLPHTPVKEGNKLVYFLVGSTTSTKIVCSITRRRIKIKSDTKMININKKSPIKFY